MMHNEQMSNLGGFWTKSTFNVLNSEKFKRNTGHVVWGCRNLVELSWKAESTLKSLN
jgi:hypothetical protein